MLETNKAEVASLTFPVPKVANIVMAILVLFIMGSNFDLCIGVDESRSFGRHFSLLEVTRNFSLCTKVVR